MDQVNKVVCPDCGDEVETSAVDRRDFLKSVTAAAAGGITLWATPNVDARPTPTSTAETAVKALYESLTEAQRRDVCFAWDYQDRTRGVLRTHVSNNWQITRPHIDSSFFTSDQRRLIQDIYRGIFNPDWHERLMRQLRDDTDGKPWGADQSIAIFGTPNNMDQFEFVMTGRHLTCRADGGSTSHVALGGPIFHGHAASGFTERAGHPNNIFWPQALEANRVYQILNGQQQQQALAPRLPSESAIGFRAETEIPGIPCADLTRDQKEAVERVLTGLLAPYRREDVDEVRECMRRMGGLDRCRLTFYRQGALQENVWDNWRLEGPSFVWYFRGTPHVHIWINVADDPQVRTNVRG